MNGIMGLSGGFSYGDYQSGIGLQGAGATKGVQGAYRVNGQDDSKAKGECQTCKNRKYQDGSDENVSFKSPTHISPGSSAAAVMGHEQEHVSNAYAKAAQGGGEVVSCSVSIHTAVCPECGRSYVAGGTTSSVIKYSQDDGSSKSKDTPGRNGESENFQI